MSWIFVVRALSYTLGSTIGGILADKKDGIDAHVLLLAALLNGAVTLALIPMAKNAWMLFALFSLNGLTNGALTNLPQVLLIKAWGADFGPWMQGLHAFYGLGATLAPLLAMPFVGTGHAGDIGNAYYIVSALHACVAGILLYAKRSLQNESCKNADDNHSSNAPLLLGRFYGRAATALTAVFVFLYVGSEVTFGGLLYAYARKGPAAMSDRKSASITTVFWSAFTAGRFLAIPVSRRICPQDFLSISLAGVAVSLTVLCYFAYGAQNAAFLWIGACMFGAFNAPIYATAISLLGSYVSVSGKVMSVLVAADTLGEMSIPALIGQLMAHQGENAFVLVTTITCTAAALVYALLRAAAYRGRRNAIGKSSRYLYGAIDDDDDDDASCE